MDLSSGAGLGQNERIEVASTMHALVLDRLFRETRLTAPEAVFHGGTALALVRDSPRSSEDLDFMVTPEAIELLEGVIERVRGHVDVAMGVIYQGGRVALKGPKGKDVTAWEFKWDHPQRRGVVTVRAEFLVAKAELLAAYKSTHMVPTSRGAVGITMSIPVPELLSAWADKIKAIGTRSTFKWRDAFDLAWIMRCLAREELRNDEFIQPDSYRAALEATASIYDKTLDDVREGLEQVLAAGVMDKVEEFEESMNLFFLEEDYPRYRTSGYFRKALSEAKREVERSVDLIRDLSKGMKP